MWSVKKLLTKIPSVSPFQKFSRNLSIHEYQSHGIMQRFGVRTPKGAVASTAEEAERVAKAIDSQDLIVKAQILAGGRGKGHFTSGLKGGVHVCTNPEDVKRKAAQMIGFKLITKQTGAEGKPCNKVYICERHYVRREMYFAILMDRSFGGPVMVGSPYGGVDIETVAHDTPEAIFKEGIDINKGPQPEQVLRLAKNMGFSDNAKEAADQMTKLYDLFVKKDATLVEVNPFVELADHTVMCLDAKLNFDDNAHFRQKEVFEMRDESQEDARDVAASRFDLTYIGLDGNIGCMVNGAGLAMATMDLIKLHGGNPANFLDVGGGATETQVIEAFKILSSDPKVRCILVNIFGGIMRCDVIALGIIRAARDINLKVPLVVRLQGTNVEQAKKLMDESGLRVIATEDLELAAQKSVRIAEIMKMAEDVNLKVNFTLPL